MNKLFPTSEEARTAIETHLGLKTELIRNKCVRNERIMLSVLSPTSVRIMEITIFVCKDGWFWGASTASKDLL